MRWLATFAALVLMMFPLRRLTAGGALEARATLALGFLLLAAHLGGDLAKRARLPRITGYLVTGFALGPAWLGLLRADEVAALRFISEAAVALIAFGAGSELKLELLRAERRALVRLTAAATAFPFLAVGLVVASVRPWFPITVHQPLGDAVAMALVLGTVAAASSPAVTMALLTETGARGRFARTVLGVTVAKDVLTVALLTVVLALAPPLASAGALDFRVVGALVSHLTVSIVAGIALGWGVARYLLVFQRDTPLFLVGLAFFTAEVARVMSLETMIVALSAGFYLENFSRVEGERLRAELGRGSLPVYVVFFALAGAGLNVGALATLWPWILLVVGLRAAALHAGLRWAGRSRYVTPDLARYGWMCLISQAGMALGLATVARRAFPEWGISLEAMLVTMIGVHELVGPVLFRRALRLAGELREDEHVGKTSVVAAAPAGAARAGPSL